MSKDEMIKMANEDTPEGIQVNSWPALVVWAFGKFGISVVFIYAAYLFYQDQRNDRHLLLEAYKESSVVNEKSNKLLTEMARLIEKNTEAIEELGNKN